MEIRILGTRGEIPNSCPYHAKYSGILVDDSLLLDVGEKSFLKYNPKWILITHFHPDHAYWVRRGKEESPPPLPIYAPENNLYTIIDQKLTLGPYTITPIPTHHGKNVKSQGYVVKKGRFSFFYTGDLVWINKEFHPLIGHVDLVITEASFIRKGGLIRKEAGRLYGHNGIPNLMTLLKPFSKNILFIHFGAWFYENTQAAKKKLHALGKEHELQTMVGYDGLKITCSKNN